MLKLRALEYRRRWGVKVWTGRACPVFLPHLSPHGQPCLWPQGGCFKISHQVGFQGHTSFEGSDSFPWAPMGTMCTQLGLYSWAKGKGQSWTSNQGWESRFTLKAVFLSLQLQFTSFLSHPAPLTWALVIALPAILLLQTSWPPPHFHSPLPQKGPA